MSKGILGTGRLGGGRFLVYVKRLMGIVAVLVLMAQAAVPAWAASPPPIQLPSQMTDYGSWPGWANTYLSDMVLWQIMQGYPDGSMRPQGNITRAEFAAMLARAMGNASPDPTQAGVRVPFSDVTASDWFYPPVQVMVADGVVTAGVYGSAFNPNVPITRYSAAVWLGRALGYFGVKGQGNPPDFPDVSSSMPNYGDFANTYEAWIISGYPADECPGGQPCFKPDNPITRAEAAVMIAKFLRNLPGYAQLAMQTRYLPALETTPNFTPPHYSPAWLMATVPLLTNADLGFSPATTQMQFNAEPYATWQQIHLWVATRNWMALGEAKLTNQEAIYVADYGLEPWEVAEIGAVTTSYVPTWSDSQLGTALWYTLPPGGSTGQFEPVTTVYLQGPRQPWNGGGGDYGWGGDLMTLIPAGVWGNAPYWVGVSLPRDSGGQVIPNGQWKIGAIETLTEKCNMIGSQLVCQG